ncbi:MAG: hypothetical protein GX749_06145 [Ruminococcaceae bacterium]|nr:hypothetical protein [Oscillospiraceae bacterium]
MKVFNVDVEEFSMMIQQCKGKVTIITEDGDRLVTNSMLSALVGYAEILKVGSMKEIEFECELPEDRVRVLDFMMRHRSDV